MEFEIRMKRGNQFADAVIYSVLLGVFLFFLLPFTLVFLGSIWAVLSFLLALIFIQTILKLWILFFKNEPLLKSTEKGVKVGWSFASPGITFFPLDEIKDISVSGRNSFFAGAWWMILGILSAANLSTEIDHRGEYLQIKCRDLNRLLEQESLWVQMKYRWLFTNHGFDKNAIIIPLRFFDEPDKLESILNEYLNFFKGKLLTK